MERHGACRVYRRSFLSRVVHTTPTRVAREMGQGDRPAGARRRRCKGDEVMKE